MGRPALVVPVGRRAGPPRARRGTDRSGDCRERRRGRAAPSRRPAPLLRNEVPWES
ncbi:protein of unknown function [Modestobacter italicus]|uniref:Uncharacterized protein n=1 Tax=Modestobacter italicus (strain DSM 44449 / CECT 9708 / BC 501) TaxID=2732864 RepID=I4ESV0_MODI5|nr:protein of unknown function [Modestobacter marinus]